MKKNNIFEIEEDLGEFLNNAFVGIQVIASNGKILWANKFHLDSLGYTKEEYFGANIAEFHISQKTLHDIFSRLKKNEKIQNYLVSFRCKDGSRKIFDLNSSGYWRDGKFMYTRCFVRDVTDCMNDKAELKKHKEHLEELVSDRTKELQEEMEERSITEKKLLQTQQQLAHISRVHTADEMAAGIAHEFNQPLAAIANYTQGCILKLKQNSTEDAALLETLEKIIKESLRCGNIIKSLRLLVKKRPPSKEKFSIHEAIHDVLRLISFSIRNNRIEFNLEFTEDIPKILNDKVQLSQALINVIINATDVSDKIDIKTKKLNKYIEICVRDYGPGIPKTLAHKLFEPYVTTKKNGLGMGLSISRTIIEGLGGKLSLVDHSGEGAFFKITLPA